jgi:hypothetical protein
VALLVAMMVMAKRRRLLVHGCEKTIKKEERERRGRSPQKCHLHKKRTKDERRDEMRSEDDSESPNQTQHCIIIIARH